MDFGFTEEQDLFRKTVHDWVEPGVVEVTGQFWELT